MKKITFVGLTLLSLTLTACGGNNENIGGGSSSNIGKNYKTELYTCSEGNLKGGCSKSEKENIGIFKVDSELCSLSNITDKDEIKLSKILTNIENTKLLFFKVDPKTKIVKITVSKKKINKYTNDNIPKNIDILFDLTYYSVDNKDVENEVITERKKKLKEELKNNLKPGDTVTLRYIGTIDYGTYPEHKNEVLKDIDKFKLKGTNTEKIETKYYNLTLRCKNFSRTRKTKIYTHLENKKDARFNNNIEKESIPSYDTKEELISSFIKKIDNKYDSGKYSYGTYFLETLSNYENFLNKKDTINNDLNIIISDFKFQLHPLMKKRKKISENIDFSFPPKKLSLWKKGSVYYDFYTKTVPNYFNDRCKHNEKLDLVGLETDDIEIKKIMKDYYKNYLFKSCNVEYK